MHSWISTQATDGWDAFERREGEEHGPIITSKGHTLVLEDLERCVSSQRGAVEVIAVVYMLAIQNRCVSRCSYTLVYIYC